MENIFNVRVYGILINSQRQLLVTDEFRFGKKITKFPGGGLQFGEGTIECIIREMKEETGMDIQVTGHFYTTDFFQRSAFHENQQVISIYYLVQSLKKLALLVKEKKFDFDSLTEGAQVFRWITIDSLRKDDFTFPIDQHVGEQLRKFQFDKDES
jgi:8-oxo-dGTP diphosphatase